MDVNITSIHFKADIKLENFIKEKLTKLSDVYEGVVDSKVSLKIDNNSKEDSKITEISMKIKGRDLYAKKQCKSFEEATDSAVEALRKQLIKFKEKNRLKK